MTTASTTAACAAKGNPMLKITHTSILAARMFYALRRDGCKPDTAYELAGIYYRAGCNLRGMMAMLGRAS